MDAGLTGQSVMFYTPEDNGKGYYTAEYSVTGYFACGVGEEGSHFNFGVLDDESFLSLLRGQVNDSLFKTLQSPLKKMSDRKNWSIAKGLPQFI